VVSSYPASHAPTERFSILGVCFEVAVMNEGVPKWEWNRPSVSAGVVVQLVVPATMSHGFRHANASWLGEFMALSIWASKRSRA
jgi:hypothetical protein